MLSPRERSFIMKEYRQSNIHFREKLSAEGESAQWTEWFAQSLGPAT